uniref:Uncharacterized protein n=1 Tax=viral metagenome TaxID=1070528 RepID=A0A6C0JZI4_9ZZZZ
MNIVINPYQFNNKNIFFLEKKKNNIIDGCFSKVIYSSENFTMNGIFFVIPFISKLGTQYTSSYSKISVRESLGYQDCVESKLVVCFYTHDVKNLQYITLLSEIENNIVNTYKEMNGLKKRNNLVLTNQLYKGCFKIYKETQNNKSLNEKKYMLKISGVWENAEEVGITYKFIEICEHIL